MKNVGSSMEKVNWGALAEIPEVCINNFRMDYIKWTTMKAFFMTHNDCDIVREVLNTDFLTTLLASPNNSARLYMHDELLKYLHYWISTTEFPDEDEKIVDKLLKGLVKAKKLVALHTNTAVVLEFGFMNKSVEVIPLYSGHDVGAIMLLFEICPWGELVDPEPERILYSGNCRIIQKDLKRLSPLFHDISCTNPKKISKAYLDTTHCIREIEELPARGTVIFALVDEIDLMLREDPNIRIEFISPIKGGNCRLFHQIADDFCQQVHVPSNLAKYWSRAPEFGMRVTPKTDEERKVFGNLHYDCGNELDNENCTGIHEDWGVTLKAVQVLLSCDNIGSFLSEGTNNRERQHAWRNGAPVIFDVSSSLKQALYCSNLSRFELGRLVNALLINPAAVVPLYKPTSDTVEQIQNLILETCETVVPEPRFIAAEMAGYWFDLTNKFDARQLEGKVGAPLDTTVYLHHR